MMIKYDMWWLNTMYIHRRCFIGVDVSPTILMYVRRPPGWPLQITRHHTCTSHITHVITCDHIYMDLHLDVGGEGGCSKTTRRHSVVCVMFNGRQYVRNLQSFLLYRISFVIRALNNTNFLKYYMVDIKK